MQVMLDTDLAGLYNVKTKALNQAVNRNNERFPGNFMFQLTNEEFENLRSQFVTLNKGRGTFGVAKCDTFKKTLIGTLAIIGGAYMPLELLKK